MSPESTRFNDALAAVEILPFDDQEELLEVLNKRIAMARRKKMVQEIAEARADYRGGKVKRGSASDLIRELRRK